MIAVQFRSADVRDAGRVAELHADSWRRHYRGAYSDAFLDGDVVADRRTVWSARLAAPAGTATVLAERDGRLVGFVHVVLGDHPRWGSLVDNLHVAHEARRGGIGSQLLARGARAVKSGGVYLWVLRQNTAARAFYSACGARCVEEAPVSAPGGDPARLNGNPVKLRLAWPDASALLDPVTGLSRRSDRRAGAR
ncbi:GNAT family N-acetyltransferase [Dactylosporangium sp. McL0621]|uniref:GNAT family N-acetyltransferase n=1 Tax=Dactylosporangium sp. McL0621 TaxID=3415678 RepID=UPI003CF3564E